MPRRRKSTNTTPVPPGPAASPNGLSTDALHLLEPLLTMLVSAGVTDFQGFGLTLRLGNKPVVERRVPYPVPVGAGSGAAPPPPTAPLTPEAREKVLSELESSGVDEGNPLFDAVRRSA